MTEDEGDKGDGDIGRLRVYCDAAGSKSELRIRDELKMKRGYLRSQ